MSRYKKRNRFQLVILLGVFCMNAVFANSEKSSSDSVIIKKASNESNNFLNQSIQLPFANRVTRKYTTASIASVSGEVLKKSNTPLLSNTLFGQLSGLYVSQASGALGNSDYPSLMVRGRQTFQDNNLLVLVDGFESNWSSLTPDEIENITILKDAAALAQFGMDAANGAIIITTKRGQESKKTDISFSSRFGIHSARFIPSVVTNGEYAEMYNIGLKNDGKSIKDGYFSSDSIVNFFKSGEYPYLFPNVNWYDQVLKPNALSKDYNLSFTGGKTDVKYFVAMGYSDYQGLYGNTESTRETNTNYNLKRYNLRANFDVNITKFISAQANLRGTMNDKYFPNASEGALWKTMAVFNPFAVKTQDGKWGGTQGYSENPVAAILQKGFQSINDRTLDANVKLIGKMDFITKGLSFFGQMNFSNFFYDTYNKTRSLYYDEVTPRLDLITTPTVIPFNVVTRGTVDNNFSITQGNGNQFNRTSFLGGSNYERDFGNHELYISATYFQEKYNGDGSEMPYAKQRIMGKISYNYMKRYFVEMNASYSGSENFPKGNRFGLFPAISGGWVVTKEQSESKNSLLNFLKIRASAGLLGNDNVGNAGRFIYNQYYNGTGNYLVGNSLAITSPMYNQSSLANPNVTWEKATRYNVGFESILFKKLTLSADYFVENRTDIFLNPSSYIPSLMGASFSSVNKGKTNTIGGEIELLYKEKIGQANIYIGANISYSKNKIIDMAEPPPSDPYLSAKGNPINQPFVLQSIGFFKDINDINTSPKQLFGNVIPGDIKYKDQNADGVIDSRDRMPLGYTNYPQLFYTGNIGGDYKGVDFNITIQGVAKRTVSLLDNNMIIPFLNGGVKPTPWVRDNYWTPARADAALFPRLTIAQNDNNYRASTLWQRDGSFLRIQNIEIGYTIPEKITRKANLNSIRCYISANNLVTISNISELNTDPEAMNTFNHPPMKSFNFGFTVKL